MGILNLFKLIEKNAPKAIKSGTLTQMKGKIIACDASMAMYQFLIATQSIQKGNKNIGLLTDFNGVPTGHLNGLFYRSIKFQSEGIQPVWVFDGSAPEQKSKLLAHRKEQKQIARERSDAALEEGDLPTALKYSRSAVWISPEMKEDAKYLLRLMGLPVIEAKGEAEAQCAQMVKDGIAWGTASEDIDSLTFGTTRLIRGFNALSPIRLLHLDHVREGLGLTTQLQFIDLCILCGCDYLDKIQGIGPVSALKLIHQFHSIENILLHLQERQHKIQNTHKKQKYSYLPSEYFLKEYVSTRQYFMHPDVTESKFLEIKFKDARGEELLEFLSNRKRFSREKIQTALTKLIK